MKKQIFAGGFHTDSAGYKRDGDKIIDRILETFSEEGDTVPAVYGHPKTDDPAHAWVKKIWEKTVDGTRQLWAEFRDMSDSFVKNVKEKRFPNCSIAIRPDMSIRHIGFLGGQGEAVKGMAQAEFAKNDINFSIINFSEPDPVPDPKKQTDNKKEGNKDMGFTEEQMDAAVKKAAKEATDLALEEGKKAGITAAKLEFAEQSAKAARQKRLDNNKAWLKSISEGDNAFISPAQVKRIAEFSEKIADFETCEFSEGEAKIDKTPLAVFQELIDDMKPENDNESGEFATQSRAGKQETDMQKVYREACEIAGTVPEGVK